MYEVEKMVYNLQRRNVRWQSTISLIISLAYKRSAAHYAMISMQTDEPERREGDVELSG